MRRVRSVLVVVGLLLAGAASAAGAGSSAQAASPADARPTDAAAADVDPRLVFRIEDERVTESSGLAVSRSHPGLMYTVDDSGDEARVFVLSMRDGSVVGEATLVGAENDDFEALAPAPGGRLVVGDTGDNDAERDSVEVYVIDEPGRGRTSARPRTVSLTYPDGARDAEAVVVAGQTVFVISKEAFGSVYAAPVLASSRDSYVLRRVAPAPSIVTDATLLADGRVVLRDYGRAYVAELPRWRLRAVFPLPKVQLGETVASAPRGRRIYVGSEGSDSPVYALTVPPRRATAGSVPMKDARRPPPTDPEGFRPQPSGYIALLVAGAAVVLLLRRRRAQRRSTT